MLERIGIIHNGTGRRINGIRLTIDGIGRIINRIRYIINRHPEAQVAPMCGEKITKVELVGVVTVRISRFFMVRRLQKPDHKPFRRAFGFIGGLVNEIESFSIGTLEERARNIEFRRKDLRHAPPVLRDQWKEVCLAFLDPD